MEKIIDIIELIACEKGLRTESVTEAVTEAVINTARKCIEETYSYGVDIDAKNKNFSLYQKILIVADDDERLVDDPHRYMALSEAKKSVVTLKLAMRRGMTWRSKILGAAA